MRNVIVRIVHFLIYFRRIIREFILGLLDVGVMKRVGDSNVYDVNYYLGNRLWTLRVVDETTNSRVLKIEEDGKDTTDEIRRFMGPFLNFHITTPTPKLYGKSGLDVQTLKERKHFETKDVLSF